VRAARCEINTGFWCWCSRTWLTCERQQCGVPVPELLRGAVHETAARIWWRSSCCWRPRGRPCGHLDRRLEPCHSCRWVRLNLATLTLSHLGFVKWRCHCGSRRTQHGLIISFSWKSCLLQWPSLFARISQRANLSGRSVRDASKCVEECSNNRPCVMCSCVRTAFVGLYFSYHLTCDLQVCSSSVTNVVTPVLFGTGNLLWKASRPWSPDD